jgi:hypothetical protein
LNVGLLRLLNRIDARKKEKERNAELGAKIKVKMAEVDWKCLASPPLIKTDRFSILIPEKINKSAKAKAAYKELTLAGINVCANSREKAWLFEKISEKTKVALFKVALCVPYMILRWRAKRISKSHLSAIIMLVGWRLVLRVNKRFFPLVNSDMSPCRLIIAYAGYLEGNRALYWQDDHHHHFPDFNVFSAACLLNNRDHGKWVESVKGNVFYRKEQEVKDIKKVPPHPVLGVVVNATFSFSKEEVDVINNIANSLSVSKVILRLHPRSDIPDSLSFSNLTMELGPKGEDEASFLSQVDVVVSGNSAMQLKSILFGVPTVHAPGLDVHHYDLYNYVKNGVVMGVEKVESLSIEKINNFYDNLSYNDDRHQLSGTENGEPLERLQDFFRVSD